LPAFGVVVIDGKEAVIALARGDNVRHLRTLTCNNTRRCRRGGQSALRLIG
jgi:peptide subunit release factor 1 (eRF1)